MVRVYHHLHNKLKNKVLILYVYLGEKKIKVTNTNIISCVHCLVGIQITANKYVIKYSLITNLYQF